MAKERGRRVTIPIKDSRGKDGPFGAFGRDDNQCLIGLVVPLKRTVAPCPALTCG